MITRRGKLVRAVLILAATVAVLYTTTHLWWVGDHYCWGDMVQCYLGDK